ncbi:Uncharacterised protein [Nocardiopsis dassonvillei]|uniref:Uncharacterized protein n=1 Tax=Nocardiopsis dassonvillei (strain ATCC 23218 / DSM 43111 / CIP 107115 / JCM 7437 / KCTC 9190 / NBRC 14626 / NCTC 10488 / NRRL B-5397 / IMRU 509) TaxID=446468 RepID=D7AXH2_NOCDD|nr:hypothetical protein Ndas_0599 [Nocardiopsis dassonvillei subsp. dassonvillei DSM 43111]VEI92067.1 Uncharacterised protein [Nocardiopsis dassonvillei]
MGRLEICSNCGDLVYRDGTSDYHPNQCPSA